MAKINLKPTPEQDIEIDIELMPSVGDAFILDNMWYRAIDIIWNKIPDTNTYKPTILLYSQPYVKEQNQSYNENYKG